MSDSKPELILASASPRREDILKGLGVQFRVSPADIEESMNATETPENNAIYLATMKAESVAKENPGALVLGSDTIVVQGNLIFGKPADESDAARMLRLLSGKTHRVITGLALCKDGMVITEFSSTEVKLKELTDEQVAWYISTGEPLDKAGSYGIQGIASLFIENISGNYANVVGLPVTLLPDLFEKFRLNFYDYIA
jgi:septum formation protein